MSTHGKNQLDSIWKKHPEWDAIIRDCLKQGWPASHIAKKLGNGLTRNAIIGKVRRMTNADPSVKLNIANSQIGLKNRLINGAMKKKEKATPKPKKIEAVKPGVPVPVKRDGERVGMHNVMRDDCRFPVSKENEPFAYCANPVQKNNYCEFHSALVHVPTQKFRGGGWC